jgi:glycosyltransferase involved in cell wall biosynthesis
MRGGAELAIENLVTAFQAAGHRAEIVRLPVAWDKGRVLDAALAWRMVPVDTDVAVCVNFPSYFLRHPRKVVWLFHQHRAAYDGVGSDWSDFGLDDASLETQRILADWDSRALEEAEQLFTISGVAADRLARFNGLKGTPLPHPPPLFDRLHPGPFGDYVFSPVRLERNKRPNLAVDAWASVTSPTRLVLAGRGSMETELRGRIAELRRADRVELPGFVDDTRLVDLMAGCLAVIYPPLDEDYGYVTLQAFQAGKPVISCADSGGVLEWLEDGVNGIVTDGTPQAIAAAVDELAADPARAEALGKAGRERVRDLSWGPVVESLLAGRR